MRQGRVTSCSIEEALAVYTTAVAQCDVADETGVAGNDITTRPVVNGQRYHGV